MIKKVKENGGKVVVWQHGGAYSYTDYFQHYVTDYKNADYFLSEKQGYIQSHRLLIKFDDFSESDD